MQQDSEKIARTFNRAGTNPLCGECGYRMVALDDRRVACDHCGEIVMVERRAARHAIGVLADVFGPVQVSDAGR